jgi:DNA-binding NarL/FixJ family response regulator
MRNCSRCGSEFPSDTGSACPTCRAARATTEKPVSRELSFRERQIAGLVSKGKFNKEIAYELHLSEGTVRAYLHHVFVKLNITSRTELAVWAVRNLSLPDT